ncbi:hypothetical protein GTW56_29895 [Bacillus sp. EB93]|nr:hypothetical protein [Peribacillus frigoritolerans]NCT39941.1 hypothetical protein [Peribacillus frigoritolerans]
MGNKLYLNQKDRKLLIISQITKDYDWLNKLLLENERITEGIVEGLEEKQKGFIQDILPLVRENASNEWKESNRPMLDLGENSKNWGNVVYAILQIVLFITLQTDIPRKS